MKTFDENARIARAGSVLVIQELDDKKIFSVRSSKGDNAYTVDLAKGTCNCGDFVYRCASIGASCKHIIACRKLKTVMSEVVA
jgi:predicted nucleic acid-binding Zn finger protein